MEAGNRCFDDRVPEEVNRRVIDHSSDVLMPYTEPQPRQPAARGHPPEPDPRHRQPDQGGAGPPRAIRSTPSTRARRPRRRARRVPAADDPPPGDRRRRGAPAGRCSEGPPSSARTSSGCRSSSASTRARAAGWSSSGSRSTTTRVRPYEPFGFFDFVALERHARCVLTDSGTVQEECCIIGVPTVTVRDTTERPGDGRVRQQHAQRSGPGRDPPLPAADGRRFAAAGSRPPEYLVEEVSAHSGRTIVLLIRARRRQLRADAATAIRGAASRSPIPARSGGAAHGIPVVPVLRRLPRLRHPRRRPLPRLPAVAASSRQLGDSALGVLSWGILPRSLDVLFIVSGFVIYLPTVARDGDFGRVELLRDPARGAAAARLLRRPLLIADAARCFGGELVARPTRRPGTDRRAFHGSADAGAAVRSTTSRSDFGVVPPVWTLSVEVGFYIVLPLVAARLLPASLVGLAVAAAIVLTWQPAGRTNADTVASLFGARPERWRAGSDRNLSTRASSPAGSSRSRRA